MICITGGILASACYPYASCAEEKFHLAFPSLTYISNQFYPSSFTDSNNKIFDACPDFQLPSGIFIEFKDAQLNYILTKDEAKRKAEERARYACTANRNDCHGYLKTGWNHSLYKQAIVQKDLREQGKRMVVVFSVKTELTTQFINRARKAELDYCIVGDEKFNALFSLNIPATLH